jgi:3-oxoacyl-[acyl-carrier protein] reductase
VVDEITKRGGKALALSSRRFKQGGRGMPVAQANKAFGRLDILVDNAGVYRFAPIEATESEFHRQFNTNVLGVILATQEAVKCFNTAGGTLINISSVATSARFGDLYRHQRRSGCYHPRAGKGARAEENPGKLNQYRRSRDRRLSGYRHSPAAISKRRCSRTRRFGRVGQPEHVALTAVFLASAEGAWITGETLRVAGGFH